MNSLRRRQKGNVYLPKFKVTYGIKSLKNSLRNLGMVNAFTAQADFRNMVIGRRAHISDVLHKAVIDLNEKGTTAAAVTVVRMGATMAIREEIFNFNANRPFMYFIVDNRTKLILFMGTLYNPRG